MYKNILSLVVLIIVSFSTYAQNSISIKSFIGNKSHMIDATKQGFVEVEQYYVLKGNTGEFYGKDGKPYYGMNSYIGILINDSLYVRNNLEPWKLDKTFPNDLDSLIPEISEISYKSIGDSLGSYSLIKSNYNTTKHIFNLYSLDSTGSFSISDFSIDNIEMEFVYMIRKNDDSPIEFRRENASKVYDIKNNSILMDYLDQNIIGGAFFVPVVSLGKIEYKVVALVYKNGKKLDVEFLGQKKKSTQNEEVKTKGITPIKK